MDGSVSINKTSMQTQLISRLFKIVLTISAITSCSSSEIGESKDVAQDKIYQDYSVSYKEGDQNVEVFCQFRFAGDKGTTLVLSAPSSVKMDGNTLRVDSTTISGAFYSCVTPYADFTGSHEFIFTDYTKKTYSNRFVLHPLKIADYPTYVSKDKDIDIRFETSTLGSDDYIELGSYGTDSGFTLTYRPIEKDNIITIPASELKRQPKSELKMMARLYRKIPLQQSALEGGEIRTTYSAKPLILMLQ